MKYSLHVGIIELTNFSTGIIARPYIVKTLTTQTNNKDGF